MSFKQALGGRRNTRYGFNNMKGRPTTRSCLCSEWQSSSRRGGGELNSGIVRFVCKASTTTLAKRRENGTDNSRRSTHRVGLRRHGALKAIIIEQEHRFVGTFE